MPHPKPLRADALRSLVLLKIKKSTQDISHAKGHQARKSLIFLVTLKYKKLKEGPWSCLLEHQPTSPVTQEMKPFSFLWIPITEAIERPSSGFSAINSLMINPQKLKAYYII